MTDQATSPDPSRILIVEDDSVVALRIERLLTDLGYAVSGVVSTGERALSSVKTHPPDLVLMDIHLAGEMDGIETAAWIRARFDVPIVYLSAYSEQMALEAVKHTQPYGFLAKPIRDQALGATVEMALYKHRLEARLCKSEDRNLGDFYELILDNVQDGIWVTDEDERIIYFNQGMTHIAGVKARDVLGLRVTQDFPPETTEHFLKFYRKAKQKGQPQSYQAQVVTPAGRTTIQSGWLIPRFEDGEYAGMICTTQDITQQVRAEAALRESEERLRRLIESTNDLIFLTDLGGRYLYYNGPSRYGLTSSDVSGKTPYDWFPPDVAARMMEKARQVATDGQEATFEERIEWQGQTLWFLDHMFPVRDDAREIIAVGTISRDITERVQAQEALRESEETLGRIIEGTQAMLVNVDARGRITYVNDGAAAMLAYRPEALIGQFYLRFVYPEDRARVNSTYIAQIEKGIPSTSLEFRVTTGNGDVRWVNFVAHPIDQEGQTGLALDITERKRAEEALRAAKNRLQILHEIDAAILTAQSPKAISRAALEHLYALIPYQFASVSKIDLARQRAREIIVLTPEGPMETEMSTWQPLSKAGQAITAAQEGQTRLVQDLSALETLSPLEHYLDNLGVQAYVSLPMVTQDELVGSLNLAVDAPDFFQSDHIEILEQIAASLAIALRQANLLAQTQRDAETQALLLRDVNHRVMNNMTMILSILKLEMQQQRTPEAEAVLRTVLQDISGRVRGMATVHRMLSSTQEEALDPGAVVSEIIHAALSGSPIQHQVAVKVDAPDDLPRVSAKQAMALALIINELTTNSVKHAFADRSEGQIRVQVERMATGEGGSNVRLVFQDDGPGWPEDVLAGERHNMGLWLVQASVTYTLNGQVTWYNDGGAVIEIQIPT